MEAERDRLEDLLSRHFEGGLSPAEEKELAALLEASPGARRLAASYMRLEGTLSYLGKAGCLRGEVPAARGWRRRRAPAAATSAIPWFAGAAAAALLVLLPLFLLHRSPGSSGRAEPAPEAGLRRAEEERKEREARLEAIEREIRAIPLPAPEARPDPAVEAALAAKEEERRRLEAELEIAREIERRAREAAEEDRRAPAPPPGPPPAAPRTEVAVARLEEAEGEVSGRAGEDLAAGRVLETGRGGRAVVAYADGTRLELSGPALLRGLEDGPKGTGAFLARGVAEARVPRRPSGRPFTLGTPHAEARVLGTRFTLSVTESATRLEVSEGRVRLTRSWDRRSVDVPAGHFAVAAAGVEPAARPLPIEEVVLIASRGRIAGGEWRLVKDAEASSGEALENLATANNIPIRSDQDRERVDRWFRGGRSRSWVAFVFEAEAGRDYRVWVRGRCLETGPDRGRHDDVMLEVAGGRFVGRPGDWYPYAEFLCPFQGFGYHEGYWWSGGAHDPTKTQTPILVRFNRPGLQALRMHASEPPMRVDAIWLSAAQATRPAPEAGPGRK